MATAPFKRLLIANRGEIACRIIRTAKRLGIATVAVYSDVDRQTLHTQLADQAVAIGPAPATDSYLNSDTLLAVATEHGIDAIHPGYGFLSERADFAQACADRGFRFIGPPPQAIAAMGSKSQAKAIMASSGVPLLPGYHGDEQTDAALQAAAAQIGWPLLIKAAYGGGGKGMRIVHNPDTFLAALAAARREAIKAFGNDRLLLERYLINPRHVEVQIAFDSHGQGIYLFDRDCSLQRRHQKIIEEAPAPGLSAKVRQTMGEAAVAAGQAIAYEGVGTVEFLLDGEAFYFMEMNTRLQVEHPVTELITGLDLVAWQLRIAAGEPLPVTQAALTCHGHAIEARLYAEDPAQDFLPCAGRISHLAWPVTLSATTSPATQKPIRIDAGIQAGDVITPWYDPLLAKIIAWGADRDQAIQQLTTALAHSYQAGLTDNRDYLIALLNQPAFQQAQLGTAFIDHCRVQGPSPVQQGQLLVAASLYCYEQQRVGQHLSTESPTLATLLPAWRLAGVGTALMEFYWHDQRVTARVSKTAATFTVVLPAGHYTATACWQLSQPGLVGQLTITPARANPSALSCRVMPLPDQRIKVFLPDTSAVLGLPGSQTTAPMADKQALTAPMDGTLTLVSAQAGQAVQKGDRLLIMEAMKMEYTITAPTDGVIAEVCFAPGNRVEAGAVLLVYAD